MIYIIGILLLSSLALCLFSGCSSSDKNSDFIQLNRQLYERIGYRTAEVVYGDISDSITLELKGDNIESFTTYINISNPKIDKVYVEEGDYVHKGQIMAEFQMKDLQDEYESCKTTVIQCQNELERYQRLYKEDPYDAYGNEIRTAQDNLIIAQAKLQELEARTNNYRLIAPVDGVVTSIFDEIYSESIAPKTSLITVTTQPAYYVGTNDTNYDLTVGSVYHGTTGTIESNFTLVKYDEATKTLYFITDTDLYTVNSRLSTELELFSETLTNQLYVEENMIDTVNGTEYVYLLEGEFFTPKVVKTERIIGDYAIISGDVKAGDIVCIK